MMMSFRMLLDEVYSRVAEVDTPLMLCALRLGMPLSSDYHGSLQVAQLFRSADVLYLMGIHMVLV